MNTPLTLADPVARAGGSAGRAAELGVVCGAEVDQHGLRGLGRYAHGVTTIEELTQRDWPLWRELRLTALGQAPEGFKARLADWGHGGEVQWRERLADPRALKLVARLEGEPVGLARGIPAESAADEAAGVCELRSLWVAPQARGRGVADRLISAVEAWARERGARTLRLAVVPGNERALAVYRRHGFGDTAIPGDLLADGSTRQLVLEKSLAGQPAERRESDRGRG